MLERYFIRKAIESGDYTRIGRWWDRKGNNEIDMIAEDELAGKADFFEIKRKSSKISLSELKDKFDVFLSSTHAFKDYDINCRALSMEDM